MANMHWDNEYKNKKRLWGESPSELAVAVVEHLKRSRADNIGLNILDIGCGYGRDAFHYTEHLKCDVHGVDISPNAIEMASRMASEIKKNNVDFRVQNFKELKEDNYDVVTASNLYQLLKKQDRAELVNAIARTLKPDGLLFLSTLSVNDPEHRGKGTPVPGERNSYQDSVYLHLSTERELMADFGFLNIKELYEHEYDEPRVTGEVHHHISWILIGKNERI
jgi:cyclopropane fatty-acyl-phospholipid synthase-like methyltransferase